MFITASISYPPTSAEAMAKLCMEAWELQDGSSGKHPSICFDRQKDTLCLCISEHGTALTAESLNLLKMYLTKLFGIPGAKFGVRMTF